MMIPKNILKTVYKVSDFISWQRNKSLVLSPSFQRRAVWKPKAKSYLIDTIVRGLPIPIIFIREQTDLRTLEPIREVVDGQQRLRTLFSFIDPTLLKDFNPKRDEFVVSRSHNKAIAGKKYSAMDRQLRKDMLDYEFATHVLPSDTEDIEVLQIFARMNSTGYKLTRQELRNAQWSGEFKTLAYNLAYEQLNRWRTWRVVSEDDISRMNEVEETSDFIITMMIGLHSKSQPTIDRFYKNYDEDFEYDAEVTNRFKATMDAIDKSVGQNLNCLRFSRKDLFRTLLHFYYDLMFGLGSKLEKQKANPVPTTTATAVSRASKLIEEGNISDSLKKVLRGATGGLESVKLRLKLLKDVYKDVKA